MQTVRMGIIGVGGIGSAHFNCVGGGKIAGMTLAAACDIDPARLDYAKAFFPTFPSMRTTWKCSAAGLSTR